MVMISRENFFSAWVFLTGVILAVMIGLSTSSLLTASIIDISFFQKYSRQIYALLVLMGIAVGFSINVPKKEVQTFLLSGTILVIVSKFGMEGVRGSIIGIGVGDIVSSTFGALLALFAPATIIMALKTLFSITKI